MPSPPRRVPLLPKEGRAATLCGMPPVRRRRRLADKLHACRSLHGSRQRTAPVLSVHAACDA